MYLPSWRVWLSNGLGGLVLVLLLIDLGGLFKIEQGLRQTSWETVQRLANALGVEYSAFADPKLAVKGKRGRPSKGT